MSCNRDVTWSREENEAFLKAGEWELAGGLRDCGGSPGTQCSTAQGNRRYAGAGSTISFSESEKGTPAKATNWQLEADEEDVVRRATGIAHIEGQKKNASKLLAKFQSYNERVQHFFVEWQKSMGALLKDSETAAKLCPVRCTSADLQLHHISSPAGLRVGKGNQTELRSSGGNAEVSPGGFTKSGMRSCLSICSNSPQTDELQDVGRMNQHGRQSLADL
eukprot:s3620_g2.t2